MKMYNHGSQYIKSAYDDEAAFAINYKNALNELKQNVDTLQQNINSYVSALNSWSDEELADLGLLGGPEFMDEEIATANRFIDKIIKIQHDFDKYTK